MDPQEVTRDIASQERSRFHDRRSWGLVLGPAVFLLLLALPLHLTPAAHRLAAVFSLVIVWWVTEAVPLAVTAILGPALAALIGVAPAGEAFSSFGNPIIFLFLGSFLIAGAMSTHGMDRRIALFVLSRRWVGEDPERILFAFGVIGAALSMWMSNTATTAMMLPIALGVLRVVPQRSARYEAGLLLTVAFSCNIGGIATPVGTPPNLIAIGLLEKSQGVHISFLEWMRFGVPIAVVLLVALGVIMRIGFSAKVERFEGSAEVIRNERARLGPWSAGERGAALAFVTAVLLWTLPGILEMVLGGENALASTLQRALPESVSAVLAASLLFLLPAREPGRRTILQWEDARDVDWGTILLFGGGLSMGSLAFSTGLAQALGSSATAAIGQLPVWLIALVAIYVGEVLTEFMSNTATANMLLPLFLALGAGTAAAPQLAAIAATLGCSLAFCLPVATPPNAIVFGSGRVPLTTMIRAGVLLDLVAGVLTWALLMAFFG